MEVTGSWALAWDGGGRQWKGVEAGGQPSSRFWEMSGIQRGTGGICRGLLCIAEHMRRGEAGGESVMLALNTQKPKWAAKPARSMERDSAVMLRGRDGDIGYERQTPAPWGPNESLFLKHH